jgi:hypothetical protein
MTGVMQNQAETATERCSRCGQETSSARGDYYLPVPTSRGRVLLLGIFLERCQGCRRSAPVIPSPGELQALLNNTSHWKFRWNGRKWTEVGR